MSTVGYQQLKRTSLIMTSTLSTGSFSSSILPLSSVTLSVRLFSFITCGDK